MHEQALEHHRKIENKIASVSRELKAKTKEAELIKLRIQLSDLDKKIEILTNKSEEQHKREISRYADAKRAYDDFDKQIASQQARLNKLRGEGIELGNVPGKESEVKEFLSKQLAKEKKELEKLKQRKASLEREQATKKAELEKLTRDAQKL